LGELIEKKETGEYWPVEEVTHKHSCGEFSIFKIPIENGNIKIERRVWETNFAIKRGCSWW
jgi:delta-aminolevulinic acid dehydratase/porphobilinogen synthase